MDLTIPTASLSDTPKPYTVYTIAVHQSLRNYSLQKRYSDFSTLNDTILSQCDGISPPSALPAKSWLKSTVGSPALTEQRRQGLEVYLKAINESIDARWRSCPAWKTFLNLPSNAILGPAHKSPAPRSNEHATPINDPSTWLDVHRDLKSQLRDARLHVSRRDQATTAQTQHEASADVKRCLTKAATSIARLDEGLRQATGSRDGNANEKSGSRQPRAAILGEGEIRRRKDLLGTARKDLANLEESLLSFGNRSSGVALDAAAPSEANREALLKPNNSSGRRVLGAPVKETERTRELDNAGVLQLQKQIMEEQEVDVSSLTQAVQKMKQMGVQINDELELQNEMLGMVDADVERVGDKIKIAKKRVDKIK
ncbi:MAG: hypothetical protein M1828_004963 [Chrysothrix sp. TS-e1954]|nr:MAG: hypothetical protein M1828_004963 [Chrysothrix sp. TS-e1954]